MIKDALVSPDGIYRYSLTRTWSANAAGWVLWVMLNPSTADAEIDDATIRRCIGLGQSWGFCGLHVVNLFALRARDPGELLKHTDPVGPFNNDTIKTYAMMSEVTTVVAAWGAHPKVRERGDEVRCLIEEQEREIFHLGLTRGGHPRHPLYLPRETVPQRW